VLSVSLISATNTTMTKSESKAEVVNKTFSQDVKPKRNASSKLLNDVLKVSKGSKALTYKNKYKNLTINTTSPTLESHTEEDESVPEEDFKNLTNENSLIGLNSPRAFLNMSSGRNLLTGRKDSSISSHRNQPKKSERSHSALTLQDLSTNPLDTTKPIMEEQEHAENQAEETLELGNSTLDLRGANKSFDCTQHKTTSLDPKKKSSKSIGTYPSSFAASEAGKRSEINLSKNDTQTKALRTMSMNPSLVDFAQTFKEEYEKAKNIEIDQLKQVIQSLEEKVNTLEEKLREAEQGKDKLFLEKERLQIELDRHILELKQTKMEWALSEERKEESELSLKNEIKYLINKLMQVKNGSAIKGLNASYSQIDLSAVKNDALSRSAFDPQTSVLNRSAIHLPSQTGNTPMLTNPRNNPLNNSMTNFKSFGSFINEASQLNTLNTAKKSQEGTERKVAQNLTKFFQGSEMKENMNRLNTNTEEFTDSPRRVSEFYYNEKNLRMNVLKNNNNPKKLLQHMKS